MKKIYGSMPDGLPEGMAFRVIFPVLALLNTQTGDGRRLEADGGRARDGMPHQIRTQPATSWGHDGSVPSGSLRLIEIDTDANVASGAGFLINDAWGLLTAKYIATQTQHKNSVDLYEVKAQYIEDLDTGDWYINFTDWAIGATTFVGTPAFATAHGELVASFLAGEQVDEEELMASLMEDEVIASLLAGDRVLECSFTETTFAGDFEVPKRDEVVADGLPRTPHDAYFIPESPTPHKIRLMPAFGEGAFAGNLGVWNTCHDGLPSCVVIPRPADGYASFNKPGALTDKGQVDTGPIFALGGHRTLKNVVDVAAAYGGIENSWADVRVTEGMHGPWVSGHIRPGVDPQLAYAALASRISGHWVGGRLKAIVSVNSEGYDTGDNEIAAALFDVNADGEVELVASFPTCIAETPPTDNANLTGLTNEQFHALVEAVSTEMRTRAVDALSKPVDSSVTRMSDEEREELLAELESDLADID